MHKTEKEQRWTETHFDCLILTPFYTFLSLYSFILFSSSSCYSPLLLFLLLFLLIFLLFSLFRPSSALCESISRRAQTPAPHFLPCGTKSSRSSKDSYILYLAYLPQHAGQHATCSCPLRACICFFWFILLQQRNYICHRLSYTYSAVHATLLNQYVSRVCLLTCIYYSGCWFTSCFIYPK